MSEDRFLKIPKTEAFVGLVERISVTRNTLLRIEAFTKQICVEIKRNIRNNVFFLFLHRNMKIQNRDASENN